MSDEVRHIYAVYYRPVDMPGVEYAVREFEVRAGHRPMAGHIMGTAGSLARARELVPRKADEHVPRHDDDEPGIVETWI